MLELSIIFVLLIVNGVFAMTEIALVSAKKARLKQLADNGNTGAKRALMLTENPERFLSTVQIGITLVGVVSGAYGASSLSPYLVPHFQHIPWLEPYASKLAFGLVIVFITYLNIVIGELVPKNLALRFSHQIASMMATPMSVLSFIAYPFVWVLEFSTKAILRLFGTVAQPTGPTAEEVRVLVREGMVTGGVRLEESEMVEGVLDLREQRAEEIMRPKPKVVFFQVSDSLEKVIPLVASSRQNVFPVYEESHDNVVGIVSLRDLFTGAASGRVKMVKELMQEPLFVPDNQPALTLLELLRRAPLFAALVTDEFGILRGMITLDDLAEEVVGDLEETAITGESLIRKIAEDAWMVDGMMEIDDVGDAISGLDALVAVEEESFQTLAGYIVHYLERLPHEGEVFDVGQFRFEIIDMDRQRIDKVKIHRLADLAVDDSQETREEIA